MPAPHTTFDLDFLLQPDNLARQLVARYVTYKNGLNEKEKQWSELRNYIFATDTSTTSNSKLPWKNKTTRPKLCQIRDNLQANYMAALFPNERWFKWMPENAEAANKQKAKAIEAYMGHKFRQSRFKETVARQVNDYIDYGNCFGDVEFVSRTTTDTSGSQITDYIGPRNIRVSPHDIVFDFQAASFERSPKILRMLFSMGQIEEMKRSNPDWAQVSQDIITKIKQNRLNVIGEAKSLEKGDVAKLQGFTADGFANVIQYYTSGMVEIIEFEGDYYNPETGEFFTNHVITIVDRIYVIRNQPINNWFAKSYKQHCGWRLRPDNLYSMGPLDNLVGMQYRIDHLENLKADSFDLIAFPVQKVKGYVEDYIYGPNERIFMEQDSDVEFMSPDVTVLNADMQIQLLEQAMEDMVGAPKQAMGIRTPGEKTAFEVQELMTAASRIFQNKTTYFEEHFLEPIMNAMLEIARRNMQSEEVVAVLNDELGVTEFLKITPNDIKAQGKLVPMGARHFAAQNQLVQSLIGLSGTGLFQDPGIRAHLSGKKIAQLLEENLGLERYGIYRPNVAIEEQLETQQLMTQAQEELEVDAMTPTETPEDLGPPDIGEEETEQVTENATNES